MSNAEKKTMDEKSRALLESLPKRKSDGAIPDLITTVYSRIGHVSRENGRVYGGWHTNFEGACGPVMVTGILEAAVIRLEQLGPCSDDEPIMLCEHRG